MALLLIENFPTPKPGVRTPFPTVVRKAKALGITIKRPSKFMRDKDGYGYTCDFCGFREEEGDEGVSNGALNRLFRDALPHPEIPGYVIAKPACSRCAELHRAANPRIGRNQFGDRKGYEDYDYRFQSCGFLLCKEQLPEHGLLSASQKYPCVCIQCEKQQNHCANDMRSNRMVSCIYCGTNNFSENRIRCVVEQLFKKPFITRRNIFSTGLINHAYDILKLERKSISKIKTNIPAWLEIDMYCEELRLAIEHNGSQHYLISKNGYTNNKEKLIKIQNRDKAKRYLCKILGIKLIVLKQLPDPSLTGIKSHIEKPLREIGYSFSNIEWESIELSVFDTAYSEKVSHNLSLWGYHVHTAPPYIQKSVIIYTCDQNHYRFSSAAAIHAGHKCLECAGRAAWRPNQIADALLQLNYIAFSDLRGTTADTHIQVGCKICLNGIKWLRTKYPKKSSSFTIRRRTLSQHVKLSDENISTIQLKNPENPSRPECLGCLWLNRFLSYLREIKYDGRIYKSETREWFRKLRVHELSAFPKTLLDCVENRDWDRIEELLSIPEKPTPFNK